MTAPREVMLLASGWTMRGEQNSCITATAVGVAALTRLGVSCRPLPCAAWAGNAAALPAFIERRPLPLDGWSVGIDPDAPASAVPDRGASYTEPYRRGPSGWNGHLVIAGDSWVLDLTAAQFHRPQRGIVVPGPVLIDPADPTKSVAAPLPDGGALILLPRPELARWRRSPAWRDDDVPAVAADVVAKIVERIDREDRARLDAEAETLTTESETTR